MTDPIELLPCPCGKIPTGLNVQGEGDKYAFTSGNCCGAWYVEFRNGWTQGDESYARAVEAWNKETRGGINT